MSSTPSQTKYGLQSAGRSINQSHVTFGTCSPGPVSTDENQPGSQVDHGALFNRDPQVFMQHPWHNSTNVLEKLVAVVSSWLKIMTDDQLRGMATHPP